MSFPKTFKISSRNLFSVCYHDIFDYPLSLVELIRWEPGKKFEENKFSVSGKDIAFNNGFFLKNGKKGLVFGRMLRKRSSIKKLKIARKATGKIKIVPTVKMIAVTGALAMLNAKEESDIDLMIVCKKNTLWLTRLFVFLLLGIFKIPFRRFADDKQKDKLCLNIWLDEDSLSWPLKDRNFYTAHEIAQIMPLMDKDKTYLRFLNKNSWVKDYWPNAIKTGKAKLASKRKKQNPLVKLIDPFLRIAESTAFKFQVLYMKKKRTKEVVSKNKAIFHPVNWGERVLEKLGI